MLKALIKKQFLELNSFYFMDRKTGKLRSKKWIIMNVILFGFIFLSLGISFYGMSSLFADTFISMGLDWLYFAVMGLMAIALGVFGDVFNTYAGLYLAKDNDMLLSMPVKPIKILISRMVGVYAMGLLYSSLVYIPATILYWQKADITPAEVIIPVILLFVVALFILVLTCIFGYFVAVISVRLKNKSYITVFISVLFIGLYYFFYFRVNTLLQSVAENAEKISNSIISYAYPLYELGLAATGDLKAFAIILIGVLLLLALTCFVLSKSFTKIATTKSSSKKAVYKETKTEANSIKKALFKKELKRFTSSQIYMLNAGLGLILMPIICILAVIKADMIRETVASLSESIPQIALFISPAIAAAVCLISSMNCISAPSISLEGKNIWILQSSPIDIRNVLEAKERLHFVLNIVPSLITVAVFSAVLMTDIIGTLLSLILTAVYIMFSADVGLFANLKTPNLNWTSETVPVKQGISVLIGIFGGWATCVIYAAGSYFIGTHIGTNAFTAVFAGLLAVCMVLIKRWINTKGVKIFEEL